MQTTELKVAGMTCGGCEQSVSRALGRLEGVAGVRADFRTGAVVIEAERALDPDEVRRAVEDAGYEIDPDDPRLLPVIG